MKLCLTNKWICVGLILALALNITLDVALLAIWMARLDPVPPSRTVVILQDCCSSSQSVRPVETQPSYVWPLHKSTTPDYVSDPRHRISSAFGPRLKASQGYRYDWHRGIDIPADCESPVYAIADGIVRLAGQDDSYSDKLVQLHHQNPNGDDFYSNYMHLARVAVSIDQTVVQGQLLGYTGESDIGANGVCTPGYDPSTENGFDHLHFEIREGGLYQKHAADPLLYLPYTDATAPVPIVCAVDATESSRLSVTVRVELSSGELDLNRIEVIVYDLGGESPRSVDQGVYDVIEWTQNYTTIDKSTKLALLDTAPAYDGIYDGDYGDGPVEPVPHGVTVSPAKFSAGAIYALDVTFYDLTGVNRIEDLLITARAFDINGNHSVSSYDESAGNLSECEPLES